jgi:exoribonuclease R
VEIKEGDETKLRRTAKVVAIAKPNHVEEMVGYLKPCGLAEEELGRGNFFAFFVPLEKRMPRMLVPVKRLSASIIGHPNELTTNLFVCKLTGWPASSGHPRGELTKNMGPSGDMEVELRVLLQDNNIDWEDSFAPEVLDCLPRIPPLPARWEIPAEELTSRKDLRKERIFTIDPATAKDMDDAVSCQRLPDGTYRVGVHIADVTYFVKADTPLDEDAKKRATTVYMVHRSIPMLPRLLSDNMCSLVPGEDRLAFSVTWRMDKEGNVLEEPWFGRTIIRSCVKMSYEAAQEMLDDRFTPPSSSMEVEPTPPDAKPVIKRGSIFVKDPTAPEHRVEDIVEDVKVLNEMAESLRKKRFEDGSLTLDDAKMYFCLDDDKMPIDVGVYVRTASHFLIEEFMLLANKSVAKRIHAAFPDRALLRRHPAPNDNKLAEFITMCNANSISFDTGSSKGFQRSLQALNSLPNPDVASVVTRLAMKPMCVAKYTCTDEDAGADAYRHYALAFDHYTHFTSPIRRYADVIVHRLLDACLQGLPAPLEKDDLSAICDNCNMRKTKADKAQDKCDLVFLCTLLKNHPPKDLEATVITVNSRSFEVYVPLYGVEKLARAEDLPLAKLDHDKKNQALYLHWHAAATDAAPAAADEASPAAGGQKTGQATASKMVIVQEIKPFTRLRVRLYPDLQRRPIDVRLAVVPPEGAAVPDNYYDAPVQSSESASAKQQPKTPVKQQGRKQHQQPPRPDHGPENHEKHLENWINDAREDEAAQRQQLADRIGLFMNDATQTKLHLPADLTSFERLIAHEIAEDHGLHHHSANYFCPETGTKERRLTLFKHAPPASGRTRSRSVPGATSSVPQGEPSAVGAKTPNRRLKAKAHRTPGPAGEGATPVAGGVPAEATTTPKKRPVRKAKEGVKERAAAVGDQLEAEDGAPAEVRTKVHRPKRVPKKQHPAPAAPAPSPAPVAIQQGQPEEAA